MAEKFCQKFGNGVHNLKIGKSFEKKGGGNSVYHSIRYDFKPVSVDEEKKGVLEVGENKSVTVNLPHLDGVTQTNYKGNAKPANTKDCILIIDHETGELTLERLSNQILVKKTRSSNQGGASASGGPLDDLMLPSGAPMALPTSNPYQPKREPDNPYSVKKEPDNPYAVKKEPDNPYAVKAENPYAVKKEPDNPYAVKKKPDNPYAVKQRPDKQKTSSSSARPLTPLERSRGTAGAQGKKGSPKTGGLADLSPLHSAKSSPASQRSGAKCMMDSLGRPIDSSDSSGDSSSGSDSDSDSESEGGKSGVPASMMLEELLAQPSEPVPPRGGALPTPRPTPPAPAPAPHKAPSPPSLPQALPSKPQPPSNDSMPNLFSDLAGDLDLSDDDSD